MTQIKVIILECGKTCREVNLEEYPQEKDHYRRHSEGITWYDFLMKEWQAAEDSLRTFEIENYFHHLGSNGICHIYNIDWIDGSDIPRRRYEGKEYTADILENGKARIV